MKEEIESKKIQISEAQWLEHYKSWQNTSLSKTEYCRHHNLKTDNFYSWCYRLKKKEAHGVGYKSDAFIPLVAKEELPAAANDKIIAELSLPNDIRLKMSLHPKMLLKLIRELSDAATVIR
jgi:hypothetical protein